MDGCFVSGWLAVLFAVVCPSVGEGLGTGPGLGLDARDHHPNVHCHQTRCRGHIVVSECLSS